MKIEQRLFPRYSTSEVDIRIFSHNTNIVGQLVNISPKGLAFQYTPQPGDTTKLKVIDILEIDPKRWHLLEVGCKTAYDISLLAENQAFTGSETRLCGLQFIRLTREQKEKLAILLEWCDARINNNIPTRTSRNHKDFKKLIQNFFL